MCVCNLVEAALSFPLMASSSFAQRWLFSKIGCQIYAFIIFSLGLTGIFHLVIVAVDRYLVICKDTKVKKGSAIKGSIACWLSGILWATLPFLGWNGYIFERAHLSCCINWYSKDPQDLSYIVTIMVFCLFVPMAVMSFTYGRIYITIKNSHQPSASTGKNSSGKFSRRKRKRQTKMLKMIIAMTVAFLLSWSPYAIVSLWAAFDDLRHIPPTSDVIPALLAKASVIWNPIIYVAMNQQFREGFLQFIGRDIGRRQHVAAATRSSRPRPTILNSNGQSTTISC
ncbi:visual pigment-like receptor peropsin [Lingula anatina]|uniref:Visual pigment-like receptor peropsin n=1 Tax=Lingula anatina TaxID=7574 RepID=A0A1S3IRM9_LINAN|nr:visual pigment-like receptor peropsin [Lingula anatina]|eukprot:XP_013400870.1 visual pigment-like receptor peropsin [Lingula anatina]